MVAPRNVLVAIGDDGESERAMDIACRLAADRGARIRAVGVVEIPALLPLESQMEREDRNAHELLARAAAIGERYGLSVTPRLVHARNAGDAVIAHAEECRPDLIVMGTPRRNGPLSPSIVHVLQKATCRVLVVGAPAA